MSKFYHIYLDPKPGVTYDQVKEKINLALDWFKYDVNNWIVYTNSDAKTWYTRLEPLFNRGGRVFICSLDLSNYWGWMSKEMWAWLKETPKR